jgi:hypothetical protein
VRLLLLPALLSCALLAAACGGRPATGPAAPTAPAAAPTLADVEAALLAAPAWRAHVTITASGALTAHLDATVLAAAGGRVHVTAEGELMGAPGKVNWTSDGTRTSAGAPTPPAVNEAIVIGLVRMGLLHNLARLATGGLPDHAEGGVGAWVTAVDPQPRPGGEIAYRLAVDGKEAADVVVTVDPTGPHGPVLTHRRITVHFDQGDMVVDETYRFELGVELPSDSFVVDGGP